MITMLECVPTPLIILIYPEFQFAGLGSEPLATFTSYKSSSDHSKHEQSLNPAPD